MWPEPKENGMEGDDEAEEENSGEDDEEPRFKYRYMCGSVPTLLQSNAASCITVSERTIALGTHGGSVHILDFHGNQVKEFIAHSAAVNDLSFDAEGEYIGSCSDDGSVVISSLFTEESLKFRYNLPMKAIALDPDYVRKSSTRFVTGGLAGHLYYKVKKWIGYQDQVLHSGEGPIHSVKWRNNLIAWANDAGVKVYDAVNDQRVAYIKRPRGSPCHELLLPHLVWQDDTRLVIGWGTSIKIVSIRNNQNKGTNNTYKRIQESSMNKVDIVVSLQTSYFVSGVAPFGDSFVVLAYIPVEEDGEKGFGTVPSRQGNAQRPEVHVVSWKKDEVTTDVLPIHGVEHYKAKNYSLAHAPFSGSSYAAGQWAAGDEPLYYILSPKDVIITTPRNTEDHISWLLQHGWHEKTLAALEAGQVRSEILDELGTQYLDHLIVERKYAEAASLCPMLLRGSAYAWERWVFHFAHLRRVKEIVTFMPTENPTLRDTAFEVALITSFHKDLLSIVKTWPNSIHSALPDISATDSWRHALSSTDAVKAALAELYVVDGQYEKAFSLFADLRKPDIFDFIDKHNIHDGIREKVAELMMINCRHAVPLFIQHKQIISPADVVSQLRAAKYYWDYQYYLHLYLHSLFESDPLAGKDFHDMQVELYAYYDPKMLLSFLRGSQHYTLDKAHEICVTRDLLREKAFILGRMGSVKQGLAIIIDKLSDIEEAIEFVNMQHNDELWDELTKQCLNKPEMLGVLLEHTVGNFNPLYIVKVLPNGLEIPRLRDRLVKIITDYRTETSLRHGCNDILKADCVNLQIKYYKEARRAIYLCNEEGEPHNKRDKNRVSQQAESIKSMEVKSKNRGGARCCMCFDPFSVHDVSVYVFFCCHSYHETCLMDSIVSISGQKKPATPKKNKLSYYECDGGAWLHCILCTTAAGG